MEPRNDRHIRGGASQVIRIAAGVHLSYRCNISILIHVVARFPDSMLVQPRYPHVTLLCFSSCFFVKIFNNVPNFCSYGDC